ncbi:hypothetical protein [Roseovarius sp. MMSF_3350]|uniref:hypothetical protein n=1 Tax=Roseovarius sp. MMSF_3350 TaxID=3046706 RepID=UPI00273E1E4D|nr:hypothetical protein [Roseovarius sp. MMSF_3350]
MSDPRKPIYRPGQDEQENYRVIAHDVLMIATREGAKALNTTGASFVVMGMGIWTAELAELDGKATAQMLRSLADLFDPASNDAKKRHAEKKRQTAVNRIFAQLDLEMSKPAGSA